MLRKIGIKNFQSHKNSVLEFVPGVNVIFGISRNGKTAVRRALEWVSTNRPMGGRFFSNFAGDSGETKVEIEVDDASPISLEKKIQIKDGEKVVTKAIYRIGEDEFTGAGRDVPDVIREALNLSEINIQGQLDAPFLITSAPGEVGRVINRITKLEEADEWGSRLTTKINTANKEIDIFTNQLRDKEELLKEYEILPVMEIRINELKEIQGNYETKNETVNRIEDLIADFIAINGKIIEVEKILEVEKLVEQAEKIKQEFDNLTQEQELIEDFIYIENEILRIEKFLTVQDQIKNIEGLLFTLQNEQIAEKKLASYMDSLEDCIEDEERITKFLQVEILVNQVGKDEVELEKITAKEITLHDLIVDFERIEEEEKESLIIYERAKDGYTEELQKRKICPYCFEKIDEDKIKEILGRIL